MPETYQTILDWLYAQLPMYQRTGGAAYKIDLEQTIKLASYLGNPQEKFRSIHVAGTNGKGSVSHMIASVLQEAGLKVGLYTSPHLKDFRERIRINGQMISKEAVIEFVKHHRMYFETEQLSFFEMNVGMAFDHFARERVDVAVVEVGMGGRLDSTNILTPALSVITNIGWDHMRFLGNSLEEIAGEKAGIIKKDVPVVIGETLPETQPVFAAKAREVGAPIRWAEEEEVPIFESDLKGDYQVVNLRTATTALYWLKDLGWSIPEEAIRNGLANVVRNTGLKGRWQVLATSPKVICDTAHNEAGLTWVMNQLMTEPHDQIHLVLGSLSDKDLKRILPLFPTDAIYYFCKPDVPRGMDASELQQAAKAYGLIGKVYPSVHSAYDAAFEAASDQDVIFIGGTTFVVAEVV